MKNSIQDFIHALNDGAEEEIKKIAQTIDINARDINGNNGLVWSIHFDNYDTAKILLERGAKPDDAKSADCSALEHLFAEYEKNQNMIRLFLSFGATIADYCKGPIAEAHYIMRTHKFTNPDQYKALTDTKTILDEIQIALADNSYVSRLNAMDNREHISSL